MFHDMERRDLTRPLAVLLFVRNAGGEVLAISRKEDHTQFGLIGGKVDPEDGPVDPDQLVETLCRAVIREVREEIGVELRREDLVGVLHHPDEYGYWNFCFGVHDGVEVDAATQEGEGVTTWVDWDVLVNGPFKEFNTALRAHVTGA
jgi:8-oxo-dGTP pyrophosphatase MutT (NUDIX family)